MGSGLHGTAERGPYSKAFCCFSGCWPVGYTECRTAKKAKLGAQGRSCVSPTKCLTVGAPLGRPMEPEAQNCMTGGAKGLCKKWTPRSLVSILAVRCITPLQRPSCNFGLWAPWGGLQPVHAAAVWCFWGVFLLKNTRSVCFGFSSFTCRVLYFVVFWSH